MNQDIGPILKSWPVGQSANVRKIIGEDGREKVQIRVCIQTYHGILQFECDGRPDGQRPHDQEFALDYWQQRAERQIDFTLSQEAAKELFEESAMIYQRYVLLLQMGDYQRVIRDTERNMRLFRFVHTHAARKEDRNRLEKWWPYIIRIHHTARALLSLERGDLEAAAAAVQAGYRQIHDLQELDDETFRQERQRSLAALEELRETIEKRRPLNEISRLEREKQEAVEREDFELAARLRDQIQALRRSQRGNRPES